MKYFIYILITFCIFFEAKSQELNIRNLSDINSEADDFAPIYRPSSKDIYFNSKRSGQSKFYTTKFDETGKFQSAEILKADINHSRNLSYISFVNTSLAYYGSFRKGKRQPYVNLFYTQTIKGNYIEGKPINEFVCDCFVMMPSVSPDGKSLVYVTDKDSELGDTDLWISYLDADGRWVNPQKMGVLNSPGNEVTPFFASNDTIYFASDGFEGPGGFDVYFSYKFLGEWQRPTPMFEINTEYNESDFTILPNRNAVFASDRPGGKGGLDLYLAENINSGNSYVEYTPKIDVSLSSFVTSIRAKKYVSADFTLLSQYLYFENNNSDSFQDLESSYYFSSGFAKFENLAQIMKENSDTKLRIVSYTPSEFEQDTESKGKNAKYYADLRFKNLVELLYNKYQINKDRFIPDYAYYNPKEGVRNWAIIDFDDKFPEIVNSNKIDSVVFEPHIFGFGVSARPAKDLLSWKAFISDDNINFQEVAKGDTVPAFPALKLLSLKSDVLKSDSIIFKLEVLDLQSNVHTDFMTIDVVQTQYFNNTQQKSDELWIKIHTKDDFEKSRFIEQKILQFISSLPDKNTVALKMQKNNKFLSEIAELIKNRIQNLNAKIEVRIEEENMPSKNSSNNTNWLKLTLR